MKESLILAKQELKRADHIIFVSLKYSRTGDVIRNVLVRLVTAMGFILDSLLKKAEEEKRILELPNTPAEKFNLIRELYGDDTYLMNYIEFYILIRKLSRAEYKYAREFRRHVTITASVDNEEIEIDIDIISEYYHLTCDFMHYVYKLISGMDTESE